MILVINFNLKCYSSSIVYIYIGSWLRLFYVILLEYEERIIVVIFDFKCWEDGECI